MYSEKNSFKLPLKLRLAFRQDDTKFYSLVSSEKSNAVSN